MTHDHVLGGMACGIDLTVTSDQASFDSELAVMAGGMGVR